MLILAVGLVNFTSIGLAAPVAMHDLLMLAQLWLTRLGSDRMH